MNKFLCYGYVQSSSSSNHQILNMENGTTSTTLPTLTSTEQKEVTNIIQEFREVFPDDLPTGLPPKRFIDHKINLVPGATPTFRNYHRLSPQDMDELKVHLKDLLDHGFIRESHSPYGAPIFLQRKLVK